MYKNIKIKDKLHHEMGLQRPNCYATQKKKMWIITNLEQDISVAPIIITVASIHSYLAWFNNCSFSIRDIGK